MPHATSQALLLFAAIVVGGCKASPGSGFASAAGADLANGPVSCDCALLVDVGARPEYPRLARPRASAASEPEAVCEYGPSGAARLDGSLSVVVRAGDRQTFETAMARATSGAVKTIEARRIAVGEEPQVEAYEAIALIEGGTTRHAVAYFPQRGLIAEMAEPLPRSGDEISTLAADPAPYLAAVAKRATTACR